MVWPMNTDEHEGDSEGDARIHSQIEYMIYGKIIEERCQKAPFSLSPGGIVALEFECVLEIIAGV